MLLKNVRLWNRPNEQVDLRIQNGRIAAMGPDLKAEGKEDVRHFPQGAMVSPGWFDVGIQTGDPGYEHREDLASAARAAAAGGFTAVACFPNTKPALHAKSEVSYVKNKTADFPVAFHPIGAISLDAAGKELAELYDMHAAGAVAFSDGNHPVQDAGLLLRALQYTRAFNGLVFNQPHHQSLAAGGQMHEGLVSTRLGLKGLPALAEDIMVQRDLSLLEYAEGRLHLHLLSTKGAVERVRAAKKLGLPVTASVAIANLCFQDEQLESFDSNWKLLPPLRSKADTDALRKGLADGTIDFICSNHQPWDEEAKNLEFPYAEFGMTGLETAFALSRTYLAKQLDIEGFVEKWALGPRRVLGLPQPEIRIGTHAELTLFDPDASWIYEEKQLRSKSRNSPFLGKELKGKVLGIVNGTKAVFPENDTRQ